MKWILLVSVNRFEIVLNYGNYKVLMNGPQDEGQKWNISGKTYYKYTICEAHNCFDNSAIVLYNVESKKVAGVMFDGCSAKGFGALDKEMVFNIAQELGTDLNLNRCKWKKSCTNEKNGVIIIFMS